jgi:hypothetical protein
MNTFKFIGFMALGLPALALAQQTPLYGHDCDSCGQWQAPAEVAQCRPLQQECTILVPQVVTEQRTMTVTRYRPETRERISQVYRDVPVTKNIEEEYTVMVPRTKTRTVEDTINHPVFRDIELRKTKLTPIVEVRQTIRTVCRMVPVQEERTVCEVVNPCHPDSAQPTQEPADYNAPPPPPVTTNLSAPAQTSIKLVSLSGTPYPDGACNQPACSACPTVVQKKIYVTVMKPVNQRETVDYPVSKFQPNARFQNVSYYEFEPEKITREEQYTVNEPEQRTRTRQITVMQSVPEQRREKYTVSVPYLEQIEFPVKTLRWIAKTVVEPIVSPCPSCGG